jgi:hypothetical protein
MIDFARRAMLWDTLAVNPETGLTAQKLALKLNAKRVTIARNKRTGRFYRERYSPRWDDFLTVRGRELIDDARDLIDQLKTLVPDDQIAWHWYCMAYNDDVAFDADDLAC